LHGFGMSTPVVMSLARDHGQTQASSARVGSMQAGGTADLATFENVRLAKEFPQAQFGVLDCSLTLSIGRATFTLATHNSTRTTSTAAAAPVVVFHGTVAASVFGTHDARLMIVPKDRTPALLVQFASPRDLQECRRILDEQGADLHTAGVSQAGLPTSDLGLTAEIERLAANSSFRGYLGQIEDLLARRQSLQMPAII